MAKQLCSYNGCKEIIPHGQGRCEKHRIYRATKRNREHQMVERKGKQVYFYHTPEWRKLRAAKANSTPYCEHCAHNKRATPMQVVDHIRPIESAPHLRLEYSNLQSLCHQCHNRKTARDKRAI